MAESKPDLAIDILNVQCMSSRSSMGDGNAVSTSGSESTVSGLDSVTAGMTITLEDVKFSLSSRAHKGKHVHLLNGISDVFEPGTLNALMGPSGSGKTTLLDILAGRKNTGKTEGAILYGAISATPAFLQRYTGYVEQFDNLIGTLTPYEMLMYTAELKRPHTESLATKRALVDTLIDQLALAPCKGTRIGSKLSKGISGGEVKRTNICIALISDPRVLLLDEPTSGLDSFSANEVMTVVKDLCTTRAITIVATIHSPTAYAFGLVDHLSMLVRGRMVYSGDASAAMVAYIHEHLSSVLTRPNLGHNDAEYLVDMVTLADRQGKAEQLARIYDASAHKAANLKLLRSYTAQKQQLSARQVAELGVKRGTVTPMWWQLKTLLKYRTVRNYTDPGYLLPRTADKLVVGLLVLTLYLNVGRQSLSGQNITNIASVLCMWAVLPAFGAAAYLPTMVLERGLFVRERSDGMFNVFTYLLAKMVDEVMLAAVSSLCVAAFVFYGLGLAGSFGIFWVTYFITLCVGIILAYFVAAIAPNMDAANAILPTFVISCLYFCGLLINFDSMPVWWAWYSNIDFVRYAWGALMLNQFEDTDPMWVDGLTLLKFFGFKGINKSVYLAYETCFFFVFFFATLLTLQLRKFTSR